MNFFGIDESEITFRELSSSEVSGAGSRTVIVAQPTEMVGKIAEPRGGGNRSAERERPSRDRERGIAVGTGTADRAGTETADRAGTETAGRAGTETAGRAGTETAGGVAVGIGSRARRAPNGIESRARRLTEPSVGTATGDLGPVGEFILGVVERMDLGPFEVSESEEGRFVVYQLAGAAAEELTAADGRATEAIQLLANQAAGRLSDEPKRVVVDAEGDRERREEFLGRMAERAARRAQDTTRAVALDPMNARDRRGIHMALREMDGVATMSVGEGRYRQVVVVPEGADEYEEALNSSRDSSPDSQEEEDE